MEFLRYIHRSSEPRVFSVKDAENRINGRIRETVSLQNNTIAVDFTRTPSFMDPNSATGCVVVLASDGQLGSISHLQTDANVSVIADSLLKFHKGPVPVCLSGGANGISNQLIADIYSEFGSRGFALTHTEENNALGGPFIYRQATLFPEKVIVEEEGFFNSNPRSLTLSFPRTL